MDSSPVPAPVPAVPAAVELPRRVIKRYSNRKLYDTKESRYVTLLQVADMLRASEEVQIIDNTTKEDLTEVTLAQILFEEQKLKASSSRHVPLQTLKELFHQRTEKVLSDLREGPIGRLIPGAAKSESPHASASGTEAELGAASVAKENKPVAEPKPSLVEQAKETFEDWQQKIDERVKAILPSILPWQQLQLDVERLQARITELEVKLAALSESQGAEPDREPHE